MSRVKELVTAKEEIQDGIGPGAVGVIKEYNPAGNRFVVQFGPDVSVTLNITETQFGEKFDFNKPVESDTPNLG